MVENFSDYEFQVESVDLLDSLDRVIAQDIVAGIDVPEFDRSTVDGYAIVAEDSHGASDTIPSILSQIGQVRMGEETELIIRPGQAAYVPTGGMVPKGSSGMIMIENTEIMGDNLLIYKPIGQRSNILYKGDDIRRGQVILTRGQKITPERMGALAAIGKSSIKVYKKAKFYIISTGDEIIGLEDQLSFGKVRDINTYSLKGLIDKSGGQVVGRSIIRDDYEALKNEVEKALKLADIVLISGGSSVGTMDYTKDVIDSFPGKGVLVHGIAIKPGKPTIVGECNGKMVIGLPGHPVSSVVVYKAIVDFFLQEKYGNTSFKPFILAKLEANFPSSPGKETYQMVTIKKEADGYHARPSHGKSGMISLLSGSSGYIVIGKDEEGLYKGELRQVVLL